MKHWMTIEYLECRADRNSEVDFRVNIAIRTIVTKWDIVLFGKWIIFIYNIIMFTNPTNKTLNIKSDIGEWGYL